VTAIFLPSKLRAFTEAAPPDVRHWIHLTGYALIALVLGLLSAAVLMAYRGNRIAEWVEGRFAHLAENWAIASRRKFANLRWDSIPSTARLRSYRCRPCRC